MKSIAIALLAAALGGAVGYRLGRPSTPADPVVARVNGEEIVESKLRAELQSRFSGEVLRDLVHQKLILQEAAKEKIVISQADITRRIEEYKKQPNVQSLIKAGQLSEQDLQRNLSTLLPLDALTQKRLKEDDEKEFLLRHREELETLQVQEVSFKDAEEAKKALAELQSPEADFAKIAARLNHGHAPETVEVHRAQLEPAWAEVLFRLHPGELSPVLANENGFHIFKVGVHRFEYKQLKEVIREQIVAEKRGELLEDLRHKAKIEVASPYKLPLEPDEAVHASETPGPGKSPRSGTPRGVPSGVPLETD